MVERRTTAEHVVVVCWWLRIERRIRVLIIVSLRIGDHCTGSRLNVEPKGEQVGREGVRGEVKEVVEPGQV